MAAESKSGPVFRSSALYGGTGGSPFDDLSSIPVDIKQWPIKAINIRSGARLDNIQIVYKGQTGVSYGGGGGGAETFAVPDGQTITTVNVWTGAEVDAIQFVTSGGTTSKKYGGSGGGLKTVKVDGGSLAYITGRSGARIDAISLVFQVEGKDRDAYTATEGFGGSGGGAFSDLPQLPAQIDANPVQRVRIRSGARLDSIQFEYKGMTALPAHGGGGGGAATFELDSATEYISQVNLRSGAEVDGIQFITSAGRKSPWYGGSGGSAHEVKGVIAGIFGRAGARVDQIGFFLAPAPNYLFTDFTFPQGLPSMTMAALKTIEATNYSEVAQTATTEYSYSQTHDVTVTAEWGVQVGYSMTVTEDLVIAEVSQEFSVTVSASTSKAISDNETKTITENASITVPPKSTMKGTVIVKRANGTAVPMQCKKYLLYPDGTKRLLGTVSGNFTFDMMGNSNIEWSAATPVTGTGSGVTTSVK